MPRTPGHRCFRSAKLWRYHVSVPESLAAKLLVASPALTDPNFSRTVVFVCMHNDDGAFGLVLNRPMFDEPVAEALPEWSFVATEPRVLFRGGPVHPPGGAALARISGRVPDEGWTSLFANVGMFALERPAGEPVIDFTGLRIFSGYSGWTAGQLDQEVSDGGWFVVEAEPGDLFTSEPESLWRRVLKRQTAALAMFAFFPSDLRAN